MDAYGLRARARRAPQRRAQMFVPGLSLVSLIGFVTLENGKVPALSVYMHTSDF